MVLVRSSLRAFSHKELDIVRRRYRRLMVRMQRAEASFIRRLQIMAQVTHFQRQASHDDLVERARQLVPHLRQRMKEMDQLGYLPEATVQELQDAGLFQFSSLGNINR